MMVIAGEILIAGLQMISAGIFYCLRRRLKSAVLSSLEVHRTA
jgi:hypothetical protein